MIKRSVIIMSDAIFRLIKDILLALIAGVVTVILLVSTQDQSITMAVFSGLLFSGIPFGWRFLSKFISAFSIAGFFIKLIGAVIIGWIALPITLIKDIVVLIISIFVSDGDECEGVV